MRPAVATMVNPARATTRPFSGYAGQGVAPRCMEAPAVSEC
jgi:hypothetical protein